jgi:class 3 adenylate cyclase
VPRQVSGSSRDRNSRKPQKRPSPASRRSSRSRSDSAYLADLHATGLPHYRAIVALDIEGSTSRPDPVKAEFRNKLYELFDAALYSAGIRTRHRDRFIDRGDGMLALIHPVDQAPKTLLLNRAIPVLSRLLTDYNASLPHPSQPQRQLRIRVVMHAGEVHYDANGCFGEALDVAFRLLDATRVKRALREATDPLILVISGDIYNSVVRHGYDGIDQDAFHPLVHVQIAGNRHPGWIHIPGQATQRQVTNIASYRRPPNITQPEIHSGYLDGWQTARS